MMHGSCKFCYNVWRTRVRAKILRGTEHRATYGYKFLTITTRVPRRASGWSQYKLNLTILDNWRRLRKHLWRTYDNPRYFKVLEFTAKGYIHFHFIIDANIPILPQINNAEKWQQYKRRIDESARAFIKEVTYFGFGWNVNVQHVKHAKGASKYLSKYMSKDHERYSDWQPPEHMSDLVKGLRMAEGSRNWINAPRSESLYSFVNARYTADEPNLLYCTCVNTYSTLHNKDRVRKRNSEVWLNVTKSSSVGLSSPKIRDACIQYVQARQELIRKTREKGTSDLSVWKNRASILQSVAVTKAAIRQSKNYLRENTTLPLGWLWKNKEELGLCPQKEYSDL